MEKLKLVLVIISLGGQYGIDWLSAFLKILKLAEENEAISEFSKIMRVVYLKYCLNQICGYWFITPNLPTLCIATNIGSKHAVSNQQACGYKITLLMVQYSVQ